ARSGARRPAAGSAPAFAAIFAALGDRTRLRLIERLSARARGDQSGHGAGGHAVNRIGVRVDPRAHDDAMSITKLTAEFNVSRQAITKHLRVMEHAGLVHSTRRGRERVWRLRQRRLDEARHYLEQISQQWDEALGRLRMFVES
ncbi:MAG: helix-turn-helix domain-containing protein, partial [Candidatus Acidiferrales bacterium]